jgi:hypothetical protein
MTDTDGAKSPDEIETDPQGGVKRVHHAIKKCDRVADETLELAKRLENLTQKRVSTTPPRR